MVGYSRSFAVFGPQLRQWWSEPVDYVEQVQYFTKRTMSGAVQVLIGLGTGLNAVISLVILLPFASTDAARLAVSLLAVLQFFWAWIWCYEPWPSRRMLLTFVVSADIGIAAVAVLDASWLLGLFSFNAFAQLSVLLMFFDGPKVLAGHIVWTILSTVAFAVHVSLGADLNSVDFVVKTLAVVVPVVATPLGIQCAVWAMRNDANESVTDPLTGLLNRRGLHLHIGTMLRDTTAVDTDLTVMVVDLDRFKDVNDTFGHTAGDQVLIRCARRIKSAVRGSALVARIGGEEFVIVDLAEPGAADRDTDEVRRAIAASAEPTITASVGVTSVAVADFATPGVDPVALIDTIIERADQAMFDAKRHGGNATIHIQPVDGDV